MLSFKGKPKGKESRQVPALVKWLHKSIALESIMICTRRAERAKALA